MLLTAEFSFQPVNFFCICVSLCSSYYRKGGREEGREGKREKRRRKEKASQRELLQSWVAHRGRIWQARRFIGRFGLHKPKQSPGFLLLGKLIKKKNEKKATDRGMELSPESGFLFFPKPKVQSIQHFSAYDL